jgi:DNA gyrase subunit A
MSILEDDRLIGAAITDGNQEIVLATSGGQAIRFTESDVRNMGRSAQGVKGITLSTNDSVVGMVVVSGPDSRLLTVCSKGYGKRTEVSDYRHTRRGGKGVINTKTSDRNGEVVSVKDVDEDDELMLISQHGILIRQPVRDISLIGRNTQGVKLINLDEGDRVIDVARVMNQNGDEGTDDDDDDSDDLGQGTVEPNGDGQSD